MATIVEYNGVTLYNVMTRKWDEEVIYDQSGTDEIGKKYSFVFQGVLHQQRVPLNTSEVFASSGDTSIDNNVASGGLFDLLEHVKRTLNHPRGTLRISFGTVALYEIALEIYPANGPGVAAGNLLAFADIDNGPKPRVISIVPVGSKAFRITFAIDAVVGTCVRTRDKETIVINNRWSVAEVMDDSFYVTRRITGQMRLAAGVFQQFTSTGGAAITVGFPAHAQKHLTIPPLENGFKREGISFTATADGLTCDYEIIDRQVHHAAPWPATKLDGTHTEATAHGTFFSSEMHVRLEGDAACDKRLLIERAVQILDARLALSIIAEFAQAWVESYSITDHIGERAVVEATARINRTDLIGPSATNGRDPNDFWGQLGKTLYLPPISVQSKEVANTDYNYQQSRVPWLYGYKASEDGPDHERRTAVLFFLHCYLQNPCTDVHDVAPGEPTPEEPTSDYEYPREDTPPVYEGELGAADYSPSSETFSEETKASIYTTAEVSSEYRTKPMVVGLPIASINGSSNQQASNPLNLPIFAPNQPATTRILQLAKAQTYRVHRMNLERIGSQPDLPNPLQVYQYGNVTAALSDASIEVLTPIRSPDGNQEVHRVVATYWYLLDRTPNYAEKIPVGVNPITNFPGYDGQLALSFAGDMGINSQASSSGPQTG